jgi:hypothetical protein
MNSSHNQEKKRIVVFGLLALLFVFHLATLNFPMWTYDDGSLVDFALNGLISNWGKILPPASNLAHAYGIWDTWIWQVPLVRVGLKLFGVSYWSLRVFPFLLHFLTLISLMLFLRKSRVSDWAIYGLMYYMSGTYFFTVSHSGRPEFAILALMVLNLYWFVYVPGRIASFVVGAITGLGAGFHVNIAYIAAAVPILLLIGKEPLDVRIKRLVYWGIGCFAGFTAFMFLIPSVDHIVYFFQFQTSIVSPSKIPLFHYPLSVGPIFMRTLIGLNTRFSIFTQFFPFFLSPLIALELFSVVMLLRRYARLLMAERAILAYAVVFLSCYSWLEPHIQAKYFAIMHPWLYIAMFLALHKIFKREIVLDLYDYVVLIVLHVLSFWAFVLKNMYVFTHIPFYIDRFMSRFSAHPDMAVRGGAFVSVIVAFIFLRLVWKKLRPFILRYGSVPVYFMLILSLFFVKETYDLVNSFKFSQMSPEHQVQLTEFIGDEKLVAPSFFAVMEPRLTLQCPFGLKQARTSFRGFDPIYALLNYQPTTVFWPDDFPSISDWLKKRKSAVTVSEGPLWETPLGNVRIYRFTYPKTAPLRRKT